MPITYTWTATSLIGYPVLDGETDVVARAFYTVLADDGEGHTADYSNFAYTPLDPSVPFIPYADLTNDIIIGWVQYNIGADLVASNEGSLAIQVERQVNPPPQPEVLPLPWVPPVVEVVPPLVEQQIPVLQPHQIIDTFTLPTSDVPPSVDGMSTDILG